jgi:8-oxo-dGTP pyrophosphatase MutT (NUDIX family)
MLCREAVAGGPLEFLLTLRSMDVRTHAGQVCLPGGGIDPEDEGAPTQALDREFEEEVGLRRGEARWLPSPWASARSRYGVPVSAYLGFLAPGIDPQLRLKGDEVAEAAWLPLATLLDPARWSERTLVGQREGVHGFLVFPVWLGWRHTTWGLTARFLCAFCEALDSQFAARYGFLE